MNPERTKIADRGYKTPCWIWQGNLRNGYGIKMMYGRRKTSVQVHRDLYTKTMGAIPYGMELDHLCQQKDCVNPDHMEPVLKITNLRRRPSAKLTEEKVSEIKEAYKKGHQQSVLAFRYGVSPSVISNIVREVIWKG